MTSLRRRSTILGLAALVVCAVAPAQQYGQWSWDATARAGRRSYENSLNGVSTNDYSQRDLQVFFGVNGFIVHPAIGAFSAGIETSSNRYPTRSAADSNQLGFRLNLALLSESFFPIQLYASRTNYDYQVRPNTDGVTLYSIPDRGTSYGGRVRFRGGPLRGLEASSDRTAIDVVGTTAAREVWNRDALDWSRGSRFLQQHYRIERQVRSFAENRYVLDDVFARTEEQGTVGRWHWNAFANLLRREFSTQGFSTPAITIGRVTSLLTSENHDRPAWSFSAESTYAGGAANALSTHGVEARYARPRVHGFQWTPTASYTIQRSEGLRVNAPSAGISASWIHTADPIDFSANSAVAVMKLSSSGQNAIPDQTRLSYSAGISAVHNTTHFSERLDGTAAQNQLRTSSAIENQPAFGFVGSAGTEDFRQARFTVSGRTSWLTANAYSDWSVRQSDLALRGNTFRATTLMHTLQLLSRRISLTAATGDTDVTAAVTESIRFHSGNLSVSPLPFFSLSTTYRKDRRTAIFEPRIDGERFEAGGTLRLGATYVTPLAFWTTERIVGGDERKNRGLTLSVSRSFGGLLPIVSAPKRRGSIQ